MTDGTEHLPDIRAEKEGDDGLEDDAAMLALLMELLKSMKAGKGEWKALQAMMERQASDFIGKALDALGVGLDEAVQMMEDDEPSDPDLKMVLRAAMLNLIDFSVAKEYQMAKELRGYPKTLSDFTDTDNFNIGVNHRYNTVWGEAEDGEVEWAARTAGGFIGYREGTVLVYCTQGDERVRPWHRDLEGLAYKKESFPEWLIPPIEWGCRCYLIDESYEEWGPVSDSVSPQALMRRYGVEMEMPEEMNPVFRESLAKGGRIFSDAHRYFEMDRKHKAKLTRIANEIKKSYKLI